MKRSTCKLLIGIGIVWLFIILVIYLFMYGSFFYGGLLKNVEGVEVPLLIFSTILSIIFLGIPSWILFIIAYFKWNSKKVKKR